MTPEGIVVAAVERYFSQPKFQKFSIKTEYPVQMGSDNRRADVVLIDSQDNPAAIAECKRPRTEGSGIDQLKSYLSATNAPLGIFANTEDSDSWNFYENLGKNQFNEITRSQFEKQVVKGEYNLVTRALGFFKQLLRPKPDEADMRPKPDEANNPKIDESKSPEVETGTESVEATPREIPVQRHVNYVMKDGPLQNEYGENTVELSLNGKPYYSEENGFSCASALRGVPEGLPEHIGIIIRNEQLEIKASHEQLQSRIDQLDDRKNQLEDQKDDQEQRIGRIAEELGNKKTERVELKAELEAPTETELNLSPEVVHLSENSVETQLKERNRDLHKEKEQLEREIEEKTQERAEKKKELVGLNVKLEAPTETELNQLDPAISDKQRLSWKQLITAIIATLFLIPLVAYLFIFYASVVDKAFFLDVGSVIDQPNALDIVKATSFYEAFQRPGNLIVILFPSIFLAFAIVTHHFWEQRRHGLLVTILLFTLFFDGILAIQISQKIHEIKVLVGLIPATEKWAFRLSDLNMWTVIFCGFVVSLLVSILYNAAVEQWKEVRPINGKSKQLDAQIRSEKNPREVQLATLETEMEKLQNDIDQLNSRHTTCQQNIENTQTEIEALSRQQLDAQIRAERHPIKVKIAILTAEMQDLQNEIASLKGKVKNTEEEIEELQSEIKALLEKRRARVIDLKKMDSQVSQFVNGWCKYVAQSETDLAEVPGKIENIRQIKEKTVDAYFEKLRNYSTGS